MSFGVRHGVLKAFYTAAVPQIDVHCTILSSKVVFFVDFNFEL